MSKSCERKWEAPKETNENLNNKMKVDFQNLTLTREEEKAYGNP